MGPIGVFRIDVPQVVEERAPETPEFVKRIDSRGELRYLLIQVPQLDALGLRFVLELLNPFLKSYNLFIKVSWWLGPDAEDPPPVGC